MSWDEAEADCKRQSGHLISLHDSHVYKGIQNYEREGSSLMFAGLQKTVSKNVMLSRTTCLRYSPFLTLLRLVGGGPKVVVSTAAFHARVWFPVSAVCKKQKCFFLINV